jgi:hypothetical protein
LHHTIHLWNLYPYEYIRQPLYLAQSLQGTKDRRICAQEKEKPAMCNPQGSFFGAQNKVVASLNNSAKATGDELMETKPHYSNNKYQISSG